MQRPVDHHRDHHHQDRLLQDIQLLHRVLQGTQHTDQVHLTAPTALMAMVDMGITTVEAPQ